MQRRAVLTTLTASAFVLGTAVPSQAGATPTVTVMNTDVIAPFDLSVDRHGVLVADGFTGQLSELVDGALEPAAEVVGAEEVAGVDVNGDGRLAWFSPGCRPATPTAPAPWRCVATTATR